MWDYYTHTQGGEAVSKWNRICVDGHMPLILGNTVRKGIDSQRELRHGSQNTTITSTTRYVTRREGIKVEHNSCRGEYATIIMECSKERKRFTKGTEAWGSNTTIMTPTPDVRRSRENLHQASQGLPSLVNGLVGEGVNEPPNSKDCNQCGIIMHTQKGEKQY
jgi:hypothetical protein